MTLEDVPAAEAPAAIIAQVTIKRLGSPPLPFVIHYDPFVIDTGRRYVVRARILVSGQLFLITDHVQPVLTAGASDEVSLFLRRASPEQPADQSYRPVALEGTYWQLTGTENDGLQSADHRQDPFLILDSKAHRLSGSTGCNRLVGGYELNGQRPALSPVAATRMACISGMDLDQHFTELLQRVNTWRINGLGLELFDSTGNRLAHFEAVSEKHPDDQ